MPNICFVGVGEASPHRIALERALPLTVGEIMIADPKTFPSDVTVADVRQAFEQNSQRLVLLVDGSTFRGAIDRAALDAQAPNGAPAVLLCPSRRSHGDARHPAGRRREAA